MGGQTDAITWVGHSSVFVELDGFRALTDPLLTRRVAHLRRRVELPDPSVVDVDVVLLSHVHMDHLHRPSLRKIDRGTTVVVPRGGASLVTSLGFEDVVEVAPGERISIGAAQIEVVVARHKANRGPHSRIRATPVGYVIAVGDRRVYFAGDTDLFDGMAELGSIDIAFLPIWGWGSTIGVGHLDPVRAAEATAIIRPKRVIPIHWGTYSPEDARGRAPAWFDLPSHRFVEAITDAGEAARLVLLRPGGTVEIS